MSFSVKTIQFQGRRSILSQAENGPCALLAIVNALLLTTGVDSPKEYHELVALVNSLQEVPLENLQQDVYAIAVQNLQSRNASPEVLQLLPTLNDGLIVDPHFAGGFTQGPEVSLFDVFGVKLVHGWIIDPELPEYQNVIRHQSYEEAQGVLVEAYEQQQNGESNSEVVSDAEAIRHFMAHTATQLTGYGLFLLKTSLDEGEVAILFRNNHFNTIVKHGGEVYQLLTDQGFTSKKDYVWESLLSVNGSINSFFTGDFRPLVDGDTVADADEDRDIAIRLQSEEDQRVAEELQRRYENGSRRQQAATIPGETTVEPTQKSKCCTIM